MDEVPDHGGTVSLAEPKTPGESIAKSWSGQGLSIPNQELLAKEIDAAIHAAVANALATYHERNYYSWDKLTDLVEGSS